MSNLFGLSILSTFDVSDHDRGFLSRLFGSLDTPAHETRELINSSLLANAEDFHHLVACARSIQQSYLLPTDNLDGSDLLTFVWHVLTGQPGVHDEEAEPWAETDRLIRLAKELATDPDIRGPYTLSIRRGGCSNIGVSRRRRLVNRNTTSHYWSSESNIHDAISARGRNLGGDDCSQPTIKEHEVLPEKVVNSKDGVDYSHLEGFEAPNSATTKQPQFASTTYPQCRATVSKETVLCPTAHISPYFAKEHIDKKPPKRTSAGLVSSVRFPPLSSSQFGLIQERLAHEPFWLLIAVTFLIKTNGKAAIPVFYQVKERFPSPKELGDPSNAEELLNMIRHLGLATNRLGFIQKYAKAFISNPPAPGKLYRVKKYERRASFSLDVDGRPLNSDGDLKRFITGDSGEANAEAWEIGHITQGKYTLDSWRIFCRDELLGRAQDWNGKGQQPEFQPEWMRVMPSDKELRAYLRWLWMREGWEWNPDTGERQVLRGELAAAVDEGRVEYDSTGGLRILESPMEQTRDGV